MTGSDRALHVSKTNSDSADCLTEYPSVS
jgi:hypothetical protein